MKMKYLRNSHDPETGEPEGLRRVKGPHKGHANHDYDATPKPKKPQRAKRKRQLREKYGKAPETPRPTNYMGHEERLALRAEVLEAAGYQCEQCRSTRRLTLDHIVARHIGGGNHRANLQCLCEPCNVAKGLDIWKAGDGTQPALFFVNNVLILRTINPDYSVQFTTRSWRREATHRNQRHSVPRRRRS